MIFEIQKNVRECTGVLFDRFKDKLTINFKKAALRETVDFLTC